MRRSAISDPPFQHNEKPGLGVNGPLPTDRSQVEVNARIHVVSEIGISDSPTDRSQVEVNARIHVVSEIGISDSPTNRQV